MSRMSTEVYWASAKWQFPCLRSVALTVPLTLSLSFSQSDLLNLLPTTPMLSFTLSHRLTLLTYFFTLSLCHTHALKSYQNFPSIYALRTARRALQRTSTSLQITVVSTFVPQQICYPNLLQLLVNYVLMLCIILSLSLHKLNNKLIQNISNQFPLLQ